MLKWLLSGELIFIRRPYFENAFFSCAQSIGLSLLAARQIALTKKRRTFVASLFKNDQWSITEDGMASHAPESANRIVIDDITAVTEQIEGLCYDWPILMAQKPWVDIEQFIEAFTKALELLAPRYDPPLDRAVLERSLALARKLARERR